MQRFVGSKFIGSKSMWNWYFWTHECSRLIKEILHYWQIPSRGWAVGYMAKPVNGVGRGEIQALHLLAVFRSSIWRSTIWWACNMNERKTLNSNLMDDLLWTFQLYHPKKDGLKNWLFPIQKGWLTELVVSHKSFYKTRISYMCHYSKGKFCTSSSSHQRIFEFQ